LYDRFTVDMSRCGGRPRDDKTCTQAKADFALADATDFLRVDPEYDQGITGAMKTAHLAEALGLDIEVHGCGPAHRHTFGESLNIST
jgi:hypothetical protein